MKINRTRWFQSALCGMPLMGLIATACSEAPRGSTRGSRALAAASHATEGAWIRCDKDGCDSGKGA
jgi:hypothetical protein